MLPHYSLSSPTYLCSTRKKRCGEPTCQSLTINHIDQAVGDAFLVVIRPAELDAVLPRVRRSTVSRPRSSGNGSYGWKERATRPL